jgi:hypothetical protein
VTPNGTVCDRDGLGEVEMEMEMEMEMERGSGSHLSGISREVEMHPRVRWDGHNTWTDLGNDRPIHTPILLAQLSILPE